MGYIDKELEQVFHTEELPQANMQDNIMNNIKDVTYKKPTLFTIYRKQVIAIILCLGIIGIGIMPINGTSLIGQIADWVREIRIDDGESTIIARNESLGVAGRSELPKNLIKDKATLDQKMGPLALANEYIPGGYNFGYCSWIARPNQEGKYGSIHYLAVFRDEEFLNISLSAKLWQNGEKKEYEIVGNNNHLFSTKKIHGIEALLSKREREGIYSISTGHYAIDENTTITLSVSSHVIENEEKTFETISTIFDNLLTHYDQRKDEISKYIQTTECE